MTLPDLRLGAAFALPPFLFFPGTAGTSFPSSSSSSSAAAPGCGSSVLPAGTSTGVSWTPWSNDTVSSSLLSSSSSVPLQSSCAAASGSAWSSGRWSSVSPQTATVDCSEFTCVATPVSPEELPGDSAGGPGLSGAAQRGSLEDAFSSSVGLSVSLYFWELKQKEKKQTSQRLYDNFFQTLRTDKNTKNRPWASQSVSLICSVCAGPKTRNGKICCRVCRWTRPPEQESWTLRDAEPRSN